MTKAVKYNFKQMGQDIVQSKTPVDIFYEGVNIRLTSTDTAINGAFSFEKGNKKIISIPEIVINAGVISYSGKTLNFTNPEINALSSSVNNYIIGHTTTRDSIILLTTNNNGVDCIWELKNSTYDLTLLYVNNLNFNQDTPVQVLFNYENENIQKIYWVDGVQQIRSLNIKYENIEGNEALIDLKLNSLNFVGDVNFSQPIIESITNGGNHTSGMVQYAYNLYRLNSSQTKLSPLSELVALSKNNNNGGGAVNEVVGAMPVVVIRDIDKSFTNIKIYAIKYTSLDQLPSISLIEDREISKGSTDITYYDNGSTISDLSLEEFIFIGSNPIIPKHIESKDNILFPINIKEKFFDIPDELDCRAFSFPINSTTTKVHENITEANVLNPTSGGLTINNTYAISKYHDSINLNYDTNKYQYNSSILGGEGKYIKYTIVRKNLTNSNNVKVFKDREIYRLGIEFYNKLGQTSLPKWIGDYKMPTGNLQNNFNTLKVDLKPEFYTWLNSYSFLSEDDKPVGYRILRADRALNDRSILCQGTLTGMMFQVKGDEAQNYEQFKVVNNRINFQDKHEKIPSFLTREFQKIPNTSSNDNNGVLQNTQHLKWLNDNSASLDEGGEIYTVTNDKNKLSQSFQFTKMMQIHSPEILFNNITSIPSGLNLRTVGLAKSTLNGVYSEETYIVTKLPNHSGKAVGGINPHRIPKPYLEDNSFDRVYTTPEGNSGNNDHRFIGPSGSDDSMDFQQYYRQFSTFIPDTLNKTYSIYGAPEVNVRGADSKLYANDARYKYTNSLTSLVSDGEDDCDECDPIVGLNSYGATTATLMLGSSVDSTQQRKGIEDLYSESSLSDTNGILITELVKNNNFIYLGSIYGGNTYEDKKRTPYVGIGAYTKINTSFVQIDNPGDTFVQTFRFLRIGKTDTEIYDTTRLQLSEIVEFKVETSIDLKNRNDLSLNAWDSRFQPRDIEYHSYNKVYSQQPNLLKTTDFDYTFKNIKNFDSRIAATKTKIPNESIDSWTDLLVNESLDLDGKYGPVNATINFKDEIFLFQDNAFAKIGINPRVQTQGSDGVSIELGRGAKLYDYQYISTNSGCINKWGVTATDSGIYYLDALNKSFNRFGQGLESLSLSKLMHTYFSKNLDIQNLKLDNPLLSNGVSIGYDKINNDIYLTYNNNWTICFNEVIGGFSSFYSYNSPIYIYNKEKLFTIDINNSKDIYAIHDGDYNMFYGKNKESKLTFLCNPESDVECTFNNIEYKSEAYNALNIEEKYTWENIRAYNEFQDSTKKEINLRKINRKYRAIIPRHFDSTNRIRNTWAYIELSSNNLNKLKYINHDIILYYNPNYISIQ